MRRGVVLYATLVILVAGCASVLDVDKTYVLVDAGTTGASDAAADGGSTAAGDAGDDTGTAGGATIRCSGDGNTVCQAGAEECCMSSSKTLSCTSRSGDPCPQGTDIDCDDPSDCPGQACCLQVDTGNDLLGTSCKASCPTTTGWTELCAPSSSVATCGQGTCKALTVVPNPPLVPGWFYGCQ